MIGSFSSLIEACAAIYATMCMESTMFETFWNPNRKSGLDKAQSEEKEIYLFVNTAIDKRREKEIKQSRRIGFFMLVICFLLLVLCGFEEQINNKINQFHVPYIYSLLSILIIELFHRRLFTKLKSVVLLLIVVSVVFTFLWFNEHLNFILKGSLIQSVSSYEDLLLLFALLGPIVFRLFHLWLHSTVYQRYLYLNLSEEREKYNYAKEKLVKGRSYGVEKKYQKAWDEVSNPKDTDPDISPLTKVYVISILSALYPSEWTLLWSFFKHWFGKVLKSLHIKK